MFLREMPRLSVDLDLVFRDHPLPRAEALAAINAVLRAGRETPTAKFYFWMSFLQAVANACNAWLESYNSDRSKFPTFCERYDLIVSDARLAKFSIEQDPEEVDTYPN